MREFQVASRVEMIWKHAIIQSPKGPQISLSIDKTLFSSTLIKTHAVNDLAYFFENCLEYSFKGKLA